ncbi:hypothetical protein [Roseovarius sp. SYSU LYC5161]|uniref:hypothetical protein n=1 Tax=Roseovarius halophilus (ex Wu et al. 2025) TaxID=3376060 RepID=UPI00399AEF3A
MKDFRADNDLPNNVEAKQQLLGALLLDGARVERRPRAPRRLFFDPAHADFAEEIERRQAIWCRRSR